MAVLVLTGAPLLLQAQTEGNPEDTLSGAVVKLQHEVAGIKQLKFSGYIQGQFQYCDSTGINTFAGGNFPANTDKRFLIRRGRLKATYTGSFTQGVIQVDATQSGVAVIEAYGVATDPWMYAVSLTAGIFNRPFGYEVPMSSSARETPERGRMSQILFPGERDLGAMLTFQMPKESSWNWFKIQGGFFNGTGRTGVDFDTHKDFIGQVVISRSNKSETFKYSGGVSYYNGAVREYSTNYWTVGKDSTSAPIFLVNNDPHNVGKYVKREYYGADVQLSFVWIGGVTTLRAEYIQGVQPGTSSSSTSFSAIPTSTASTANLTTGQVTTTTTYSDIYERKFNGAYFYFTQNILQTKHQIVVKYDWYDPDTQVSGGDIKGGATKTSAADIKYSTLGLGYLYHFDHNVKFMVYYDIVKNENTKLAGYTRDVKDNVITIRMQYKF